MTGHDAPSFIGHHHTVRWKKMELNVPFLETQLKEAEHRLRRLHLTGAVAEAVKKQALRVNRLRRLFNEALSYRDGLRAQVAALQRKHQAWAPYMADLRTAQVALEAIERHADEPVAEQMHEACAGVYRLVEELRGTEEALGRVRAALAACGGWSN